VIYTATLQYQEKWAPLAALKNEPGETKADRADKASIELWADAFKNVPPKTFTFRSSVSRMPMSMSAVGTPLIPVKIGRKVYNFWLDTGSSLSMLASDVAHDLNISPLVPDTLEIVTSTGRVKRTSTDPSSKSANWCAQRTGDGRRRIDDGNERPRAIELSTHVKIDGIIGFDIIRQMDLEVDYGENVLRLRDPSNSRPGEIETCSGSASR
jgi:hypothetical protein